MCVRSRVNIGKCFGVDCRILQTICSLNASGARRLWPRENSAKPTHTPNPSSGRCGCGDWLALRVEVQATRLLRSGKWQRHAHHGLGPGPSPRGTCKKTVPTSAHRPQHIILSSRRNEAHENFPSSGK